MKTVKVSTLLHLLVTLSLLMPSLSLSQDSHQAAPTKLGIEETSQKKPAATTTWKNTLYKWRYQIGAVLAALAGTTYYMTRETQETPYQRPLGPITSLRTLAIQQSDLKTDIDTLKDIKHQLTQKGFSDLASELNIYSRRMNEIIDNLLRGDANLPEISKELKATLSQILAQVAQFPDNIQLMKLLIAKGADVNYHDPRPITFTNQLQGPAFTGGSPLFNALYGPLARAQNPIHTLNSSRELKNFKYLLVRGANSDETIKLYKGQGRISLVEVLIQEYPHTRIKPYVIAAIDLLLSKGVRWPGTRYYDIATQLQSQDPALLNVLKKHGVYESRVIRKMKK